MKLAICQSEIKYLDFDYNIKYAENAVYEAAHNNADCIIFPEMSFTGFSMDTYITSQYGHISLEMVKKYAYKSNITVGFGWVDMCEDNLSKNHYSFIAPNCNVILDYVKIHPFSYAEENLYFKGGTSLPNASLNDLNFQCIICYDLRFPELFRINTENIHAVFIPANWPDKRIYHWNTLLKARAIENQIYVIGVNCTGNQNGLLYSGGSTVIAPDGSTICCCESKAGIYYADIDTENVTKARKNFPVLNDIRKELYKTL